MKDKLYQLTTLLDKATFYASSDKVAIFIGLWLCSGQVSISKIEDAQHTLILEPIAPYMIEESIKEAMIEQLDCSESWFMHNNQAAIVWALESFAYGSREDRVNFDQAIKQITNSKKLEDFKAKHEQSGKSQIILRAWAAASRLRDLAIRNLRSCLLIQNKAYRDQRVSSALLKATFK